MWNLKYVTNGPIQKTETDVYSGIENRLVAVKEEEGESGKDGEFGVGRCKVLHLEWMENEVLLQSTGNYIQSPGRDHDGKED